MLLLACTVLVVLAGFYVLNPLYKEFRRNLEIELQAETEIDHLLSRKAVIYHNLQDLEFEYKMGRLSENDFRLMEAGYKNEAALILQKLDRLGAGEDIDELIEKEVAAQKMQLFSSGSAGKPASSHCPSCGAEVITGKRYCADCGHQM